MNKKNILLSGATAGVAVLGLVYFVAVPNMQVSSYKETVGVKQSELNDELNKVSAVLERDTFVKAEVERGTILSDVKVGNEAVKKAEAKLANVKNDLTSFSALPLLDLGEDYKTAVALKADEEAYVKKSEEFLKEFKAVLAYEEKSSDLIVKYEEFGTAVAAAYEAESGQEYASKIDEAIKALQPANDALAKITPPASLKDAHEYGVKAFAEFIDLFKQSSAAAKEDDIDKLGEIDTQITAKGDEITKKSDDYNAQFVRESPLRKFSDSLSQLDREIIQKQASL